MRTRKVHSRPEASRAMREANLLAAGTYEASRCARAYESLFQRVIEAARSRLPRKTASRAKTAP